MKIHHHPHVVNIFLRHQGMGFFKQLKWYDDDITQEFYMELQSQGEDSATTFFRGLAISLIPETISRVTTLPLWIQWSKEDKEVSVTGKKNFFIQREKPVEDKNGVRREILPYPWDDVSYHILKYISYKGRLSIVYAYIKLLHDLRSKEELPIPQRLCVPHFLLQ